MEKGKEQVTGFEIIEHLSDIGIRFYGSNPEELFSNAARGMFNVMCDPGSIGAEKGFSIIIDKIAPSLDDLVILWLERLLYHFEVDGIIFSIFKVDKIEKGKEAFGLAGRAWGEAYDPAKHRIEVAIKAPTYHQLEIRREEGRWMGTVIFDI